MKKSLLIVGHGSKSADAVKAFDQIINVVREKSKFDHVEVGRDFGMYRVMLPERAY